MGEYYHICSASRQRILKFWMLAIGVASMRNLPAVEVGVSESRSYPGLQDIHLLR
jgi:hypothetical protein